MTKPFLTMLLMAAASSGLAQDVPMPQTPAKGHPWLDQLHGEWEYEAVGVASPGAGEFKINGRESVRSLGDFWTICEAKFRAPGVECQSLMTLGYDPEKKKFIGTWIDSIMQHMWHYEGELDESGKALSLYSEGPDPRDPSKIGKFRDRIEIKDADTKVLTSAVADEDGEWTVFMTATYERIK